MLGLDATAIIIGVGCAILGAILGVVFGSVKEWLWERFHPHRGVRIDVVEERRPYQPRIRLYRKSCEVNYQERERHHRPYSRYSSHV